MSVGAIVGAGIGFLVGGPTGARIGYALGSAIDGPQGPDIEGPRLSDRDVGVAAFGTPAIEAYGPTRVTAQVLWSAPLREVRTEEEVGKGGGPTQVSYSYYWSAVLSLAWADPSVAPDGYVLHRLWVNKKLVADFTEGIRAGLAREDLERRIASNRLFGGASVGGNPLGPGVIKEAIGLAVGASSQSGGWFTFSGGGSGHTPPVVQQEAVGADNTPGYFHHARLDVRDLPLTEDVGMGELGNRPPLIEAEISPVGIANGPTPLRLIFETPGVATQYLAIGPEFGAEPRYAFYAVGNGENEPYSVYYGTRQILAGVPKAGLPSVIRYKGPARDAPFWSTLAVTRRSSSEPVLFDPDSSRFYALNSGGAVSSAGGYLLIENAASNLCRLYSPTSGGFEARGASGAFNAGETFILVEPSASIKPPVIASLTSSQIDEHCTYILYKRTTGTGLYLYREAHPGTVPPTAYAETLDLLVSDDPLGFNAAAPAPSGVKDKADVFVRGGVVYVAGYYEQTGVGLQQKLLRCDLAGGKRTFETVGIFSGNQRPWDTQQFYCDGSLFMIYGQYGFWAASIFAVPSDGTTVGAVANALMRRVGLKPSDVDTVAMNSTPLHGYAQARRNPARGGLEQLTQYAPSQIIESSGTLRMTARTATDAVTVISEDALLEPVQTTRTQDKDLPREVTVTYASTDSGQQPGAQSASWQTGIATAQQSLGLGMSMSDARASEVARFNLVDAYVRRAGYRFATGMEHAALEPGDVVRLPGQVLARITTREEGQGQLRFEAVAEDPTSYAQSASAASGSGLDQILGFAGPSELILLDSLPPIRDADTEPMVYLTYGGSGGGWRGAYLLDGGVPVEGSPVSQSAQSGRLLGALPAARGGTFDNASIVDIVLEGGQLANITFAQLHGGVQMLVVGSEIIGVQYADLVAANTYRCRGFLRGMRGSEISAHAVNKRVIRLTTPTIRSYGFESSAIGSTVQLAAVSIGQSPAAASVRPYAIPAGTSRLLAPVNVRAGRTAAGALDIRWTRRGRFDQGLRDNGETRLDEVEERYAIEIKNGAAVVRTVETSTPNYTYTQADQVTDFGSARTSLDVVVYQLSNTSGRGRPAAATLTVPL